MKLLKLIMIAICAFAIIACKTTPPVATPTEVFKAQNEARKRKDGAAMKTNLSKISVEMIDKASKAQNKTVEEMLVLDVPGMTAPENFEFRNEKIEGDTAIVEVKSEGIDDWSRVPFVKEDGRWKLALDKLIEEAKKAVQEAQSNAAANSNK